MVLDIENMPWTLGKCFRIDVTFELNSQLNSSVTVLSDNKQS